MLDLGILFIAGLIIRFSATYLLDCNFKNCIRILLGMLQKYLIKSQIHEKKEFLNDFNPTRHLKLTFFGLPIVKAMWLSYIV